MIGVACLSKTNKERQSNMELLRIFAMLLIMVGHADFWSIGIPTKVDVSASPITSYLSFFIEEIALVGVNVFVLISGWFGIRPNIKGVCKFLFQCLFFSIGIYVVFVVVGWADFTIEGIAECLILLPNSIGGFAGEYWFVASYLGLYILMPILNMFVEKVSKKQLEYFLLSFFFFEFYFDWLSNSAVFIYNGYSTFSFVGLYMLARYVKMYPNRMTQLSKMTDIYLYIGISFFSAIIMMCAIMLNKEIIIGRFMVYTSPTLIAASLFLLLFFSKIKLHSKVINWIAISSFAVYMVHMHPEVSPYYKNSVYYLHNNFSPFLFGIFTFLLLVTIFFLSIFIDKLRIKIWDFIEKKLFSMRKISN